MKRMGKFLFGAMLGGFIGSVLVLLYAPDSGDQTRDALQYRFNGIVSQIKDAMEQRREQLLREIEVYKDQA
jgi:gas vesicle protein